jgi:hypothetical protein
MISIGKSPIEKEGELNYSMFVLLATCNYSHTQE